MGVRVVLIAGIVVAVAVGVAGIAVAVAVGGIAYLLMALLLLLGSLIIHYLWVKHT